MSCSTPSQEHTNVASLQADLEAAVSAEDYQKAAKLRDELTYGSQQLHGWMNFSFSCSHEAQMYKCSTAGSYSKIAQLL